MLVRRTPLRAKKPLERKPMERHTVKPKKVRPSKLPNAPERSQRGPVQDEDYLDFIRSQPCLVPGCWSASEAHHYGKSGMGLKCCDYETCPLCAWHHRGEFHQHAHAEGRGGVSQRLGGPSHRATTNAKHRAKRARR